MKKYAADINVMPLKALLDPQGKAVNMSMHNIGYKTVKDVRIGKHITMELDAENEEHAKLKVEEACLKILSNPIMEYFEFDVREVS